MPRDRDQTEYVGVEGLAPGIHLLLRHLGRAVLQAHTRIVDENVELAILGTDLRHRYRDARGIADVERDGLDLETLAFQLGRRRRRPSLRL